MTPDTFTFLSPSHSSTSSIDHVLCSGYITLSNFKILYDCAIFDHFPLSVTLDVEVTDSLYSIKCNLTQKFINWELFDKQTYIGKSESLLRDLNTTHFVRILKSVYAQTTVKVRVNESFSDSWRICRGVR